MKIKEAINKIENIGKLIEDLEYERNCINKSLHDFMAAHKLCVPLDSLKKYKGQEVMSITLVGAHGRQYAYDDGEIMQIDEKGHFYYSDYDNGILEYDEKEKIYVRYHRFVTTSLNDIIGFKDLIIYSHDLPYKVPESFDNYLLKKYSKRNITVKKVPKESKLTDSYF